MSAIVNSAKPSLTKLVYGENSRLSTEDQMKVAAWIATAVIVSEFENRQDVDMVTIPQRHREWLKTNSTAPPDWKIWIGHYQRENWVPHWIHHRFSLTGPDEPSPEKGAEGPLNAQTTSYVVGQLYIHALSSAVSGGALNWKFLGRDVDILRQIWPANEYSLLWPPATMNDGDADRVAGAMMQRSLRVLGLPPMKQLFPDL